MKLALLVGAWLAGILLGFHVEADLLPVALLLLAALPAGVLLRLVGRSLWPVLLVVVLLAGLLRIEAFEVSASPLAVVEKETVTLQGRIANDPEATARRIKFVVSVDEIDRAGETTGPDAKALVYASPPLSLLSQRGDPYFRYGDTLVLEGELRQPQVFEDFDYPSYLSHQGISGILWVRNTELISQGDGRPASAWKGWMFGLRRNLAEELQEALPEPHSALAQALLLGLRGQLPPGVKEDFRQTGAAHLLAISGLHVGVLMAMTMMAATWIFGRRSPAYLLLALAAIWFYVLVSGIPVSVLRAGIMGSVFLAALALGRPRSALPSLALSAAVMVGIDPKVLGQISFQLSFTALAGIVLVLPYHSKISEAITRRAAASGSWWRHLAWQAGNWISSALIVSLGATLATWPLVASNFDRIPLSSIPSTLLALPAMPLILGGSLATGGLGLAHPLLGQFAGWITYVPLSYLLGLISVLPSPGIPGTWVGAPLVLAWYGLLLGLMFLPGRVALAQGAAVRFIAASDRLFGGLAKHGGQPRWSLGLVFLTLAMLFAAVILWNQVFQGHDGKLHIYFFDVGQGDSILIVTPKGKQVLVDGGPDLTSATRALVGPMSPIDRSLDVVVMTHVDGDHSKGLLEVLDRYDVATVVVGETPLDNDLSQEWRAKLNRKQIDPVKVSEGYRLEVEPGVTLEVLNPPGVPFNGSGSDRNNNAVVLRLIYGQVSFMLASDIEAFAEGYLVRSSAELESTVLKAAHHGSRTSSTAGFLNQVNPTLAVISSGPGNQFGHPHVEVTERLERFLGPEGLFRTDRHGTIEFISDGVDLWVRTDREYP